MTLEKKLDYLLAVYIGAIVSAELLGGKLTTIFGVSTSVGIYALPLTFVINDIVTEVVGKERARNFVRAGLVMLVMLAGFVALARFLPPAGFYTANEAYRMIFGNSLRVIIGSLSAFAVSEFTDVWIYNLMKKAWGKKLLWLRTNLSNFASQLVDTTVFITVAFYHITPAYTPGKMLALIIPYWLLKMFFSVIETPFAYLGVKWLGRAAALPTASATSAESAAGKSASPAESA